MADGKFVTNVGAGLWAIGHRSTGTAVINYRLLLDRTVGRGHAPADALLIFE